MAGETVINFVGNLVADPGYQPSRQDLAEQFGVTDGQISQIVRGLRWKSVGGPIQTERKYQRG